jgi:hypothetical protein
MKNHTKFTGTQVCKMFSMTKERYREMVLRKFIVASYPSAGQGRTAYYNRSDLYDISIFLHLTDVLHFTREAANFFIRTMRGDPTFIYDMGKPDRHSSDQIWFIDVGKRYSIYLVDVTESDMLKMYEKIKPRKKDISDERYLKEGLRPEYDAILIINAKGMRERIDAAIERL